MFEMGQHMHMNGPPNYLKLGTPGPFSTIELSGMFTVIKVREGISNYNDPGWYQNPPGTVAEPVSEISNQKSTTEMPHSNMKMEDMSSHGKSFF